jgi:transcriptional regulator with XRE-family HTH domain
MTFGTLVREARKKKMWSLRKLADQMKEQGADIDFTYLSRVENDMSEYPLSEKKISILAQVLDIDEYQLILAAGKIPQDFFDSVKNDPEAAQKAVHFFRTLKQNK